MKKKLNSLERQARQARRTKRYSRKPRAEIELLSRDYRTMHADLESVDREAQEVEALEAETGRRAGPSGFEQEAIRLG